jgi:hypothetical protein
MNDENEAIISEALDGERVDMEALRRALGSEAGRETLASFVLLRAQVAADNICPRRFLRVADLDPAIRNSIDVGTSQLPNLIPQKAPVPAWRAFMTPVRCSLAASLAMLALAGSFWLGTKLRPTTSSPTAAQVAPSNSSARAANSESFPTHSAVGDRAAAAPDPKAITRTNPPDVKDEPPKPTRVLRFELGVDWREESSIPRTGRLGVGRIGS